MSPHDHGRASPKARAAADTIADPDWLATSPEDIQAVYAYWKAKAGRRRMPARADIDPVDLVRFLPSIMLVDVRAPEPEAAAAAEPAQWHYVYRLVGTREVEMRGADPTGKPVASHCFAGMRDQALRNYDTAVRTRAPVIDRNEENVQVNDRYVDLDCAFFPLSSDGARVDMVLVYTVQKAIGY